MVSTMNSTNFKKKFKKTEINEPPSYKKAWINSKCISLSERSCSEKDTCYIIPIKRHYRKRETTETVKKVSG